MSDYPKDLKYSETHEWVCKLHQEGASVVLIGITDYAQQQLGKIVFVELPELNLNIEAGDEIGVLESVKAATDIFSPLCGKVIEINEDLVDSPSLVNSEPYGDGWLYKLELNNPDEYDTLLDRDEYQNFTANEE